VATYCFWWKSGILLSVKPEVELIFMLWKNTFNTQYPENGEKYDIGVKGGQTENRLLALDWHNEL